jgi:hypothetical protein
MKKTNFTKTSLSRNFKRSKIWLSLLMFFFTFLYFNTVIQAQCTEAFFSEYVEGSSNNKGVEIYNPTGATIDLVAGNYVVATYHNGNGNLNNPTTTNALNGSISSGDVFLLAHSSAAFSGIADQTFGGGWFNGDDAVVLWKGGVGATIIDVIGKVGEDPGSQWGSGNASTANNTIRRKSTINVGDTDETNDFDPAMEWDGFANNDFSGLGMNSNDCIVIACDITSITVDNITACNDLGTPDPSDDTFTFDATITFENAPATGTLDVDIAVGGMPDGSMSVAIGSTDTPTSHKFSFTAHTMGGSIDVSAQFSDEMACTLTECAIDTAPVSCSVNPCGEVFFSEFIEGSSFNKCLEIYNPTTNTIDLGAGSYEVKIYFNGSNSAGVMLDLTGTILPGDVYVICDDGATAEFLAEADLTPGNSFYNGDDAVVLVKNNFVIDVIGQIGTDPGSQWGSGDASTANNTIRRKTSIDQGDVNPFDAFDPAGEWDGFPNNTSDGLGFHCGDCSLANGTLSSRCFGISASDPCGCLDNASLYLVETGSGGDDGQFSETIEITGFGGSALPAGMNLTVGTAINAFDAGNIPAIGSQSAGVPVAAGTPFNFEASADAYNLSFIHVDGQGYSIEILLDGNAIGTIENTCFYPNPVFSTDLDVNYCINTPPFNVLFDAGGASGSSEIYVNGVQTDIVDPATLGIGTFPVEIRFDAEDALGYELLNGVVSGNGANTLNEAIEDPGCKQAILGYINIVETSNQPICNGLVHASLDDNCVVDVLPDMILEGTYSCYDDYFVSLKDDHNDPVNNPVSGNYIGEILIVKVTHLPSGNSCWGEITVEDKSAPTVTCQDRTISCTSNLNGVPKASGSDNCDNSPTVNLIDEVINTNDQCTDPTPNDGIAGYVTIERTYIAIDDYGNESAPCTQTITITRPEPGLVDFPNDVTRQCPNPNTNPSSTGSPSGVSGQYCLYETSYSDITIPGCGNTYKVVRTWTVLDWCTGEIVTQNNAGEDNQQIIDIVDDKAPQITMDDYEVNANNQGTHPHPCFSTELLKPANVSDNCSDFSVKIFTPVGEAIYVNGTDGANGGYIPSPGLPQGDHIITYQATDVCGNSINKEVTVTVTDLIAPVAICDEITDVNLSSGGTAEVFAETFDDGSYDQCCLDKFEVARMEDGCGVGTDFGPYATFCCEDAANSPVTVIFRAYDCDGNYNNCMVTVNVSDKIGPVLASCPTPQTITCDFYLENLQIALGDEDYSVLDQFGNPEYQDNCDLEVNLNVNDNVDQCGNGTISRTWTAQDPSGNNAQTCTQIIRVNHVSDWVVEFPQDETAVCTDIDLQFPVPVISSESCELIAVSYEDTQFNVVTDACYKIARQWTIINWCVVGDNIDEEVVEVPENQLGLPFPACDLDGDGDCDERTFRDSWNGTDFPGAADAGQDGAPDNDIDQDPWDGYITFEQTIKVIDNVDPVFADGCNVPDVCIEDNSCGAIITLPEPAIQDCSPDVTVTVESDLGSGYGPFIDVAPGTYTVTYSAMDNCGNSNACQTSFIVEDCKKPTPYCKNGLIIELMTVDPAMVEVWATDFDAGSFDNCPGDVQISFSADVSDINKTFNCDHVGQQSIEIWVTDASGNQDYCSTFVFIQANMGQCPMIDDPLLAGVVETESGEFVKDVEVNLNTNIGINDMMKTDETGDFHFNVPAGTDLTLTPVKDINPLNGVTTYDLVLISKHILNVDPLDSPYKIIAADANKSNTVTTFDLVVLRKLILFIDTELSNNTSWRFVPTDYDFVDPQNPLNESFPEIINVNNFNGIDDADFVGIKVGDVNGNADPLELTQVDDRTFIDQLKFQTEDQSLKAGESYTVNFKSNNFDAIGYQFTLNFNPTALEFIQVNNAIAQAENFGLTLLDEGVITASWNTDEVKKMAKEDPIFSITFKAKTDARLSQLLDINSRYTLAEAYRENGELLDIELEFNNSTVVTAFELYQNRPNPFNEATVIGFQLPEASTATITITDVSGRTLKVIKGDFERGYNEVTIEEKELQGSGIRYYQLETSNHTASKKMVLLGTK